MTHDWACYLNERKAFQDQKAAFDRINHDLLINKLAAIGVHQQTCDWLRSFFRNRSFKVRVGGAFSDYKPVISGVPRGGFVAAILYAICVLVYRHAARMEGKLDNQMQTHVDIRKARHRQYHLGGDESQGRSFQGG